MKKFLTGNLAVILIGLIVVLLLALYYMQRKNQDALNSNNVVSNSNVVEKFTDNELEANSGEVVMVLFFVNWCPHCKSVKPTWEKAASELNNTKVNGKNVRFVSVDCEEKPELGEKYNVEGYPTIKLIYKGVTYDYDAKPDKDNLVKFLESSVEQ